MKVLFRGGLTVPETHLFSTATDGLVSDIHVELVWYFLICFLKLKRATQLEF
jgi:hypothetical protein